MVVKDFILFIKFKGGGGAGYVTFHNGRNGRYFSF